MDSEKTLEQLEDEYSGTKSLFDLNQKWLAYYEAAEKLGTATDDDHGKAQATEYSQNELAKKLHVLESNINAARLKEFIKSDRYKLCLDEITQRITWIMGSVCDIMGYELDFFPDCFDSETKEYISGLMDAQSIIRKYRFIFEEYKEIENPF